MRTTVTIEEELLRDCRLAAASRRLTLSGLIEVALKAFLAEVETPAARRPPFKLVTVKGKPLPPGFDLDRTSALLAAEDLARYGRRRD